MPLRDMNDKFLKHNDYSLKTTIFDKVNFS